MASSYVNDLRLNEMATGDASGTWGDNTNTNLELIGEALGFGTEAITTNADTHTTTVADGATDPGRAIYIKYTGTLDSACTITIAPNTMSRLHFIENATSGSQNIIISQGSGANVTIPNGAVKAVILDGAGSGAAVTDALVDLDVGDSLKISGTTPTLTIGDAGAEDTKIVFDGNAQDYYIGLDDSADKMIIGVGSTVGTNPTITLDESQNFEIAGTMNLLGFTGSKANFTNSMLISNDAGTGTLSTANNNTGFGHQVFNVLTEGDGNTGVGADVLGALTTGDNNTAVGLDSLKANTTADDNTAVGKDALLLNTTGASNTAIGKGSLTFNQTAANNTAVGYLSLNANTTGTGNTAIGTEALDANTTANFNTAIGSGAATANTTGGELVAVGRNALAANTTGSSNTAVGMRALDVNTTASNNTAVGADALGANTTGSANTVVGSIAGDAITTGVNNVAMGRAALTTCTTGGSNVAIGLSAAEALTTASNNTAVGANSAGTTTTGASITAIGANTRASAATTDNQIIIGTGAGVLTSGGVTRFTVGDGSNNSHIALGASGDWSGTSDERFKKNIKDSNIGLDFITELRPITYQWKNEGEIPSWAKNYVEGSTKSYRNSKTHHGFVAQEAKAVIDKYPEIADGFHFWSEDDDGQQNIAYGALMPMMVKAVQELSAQVEELKAKINEDK